MAVLKRWTFSKPVRISMAVAILFSLTNCSTRTSHGILQGTAVPRLLHVFNDSTVGYFTPVGYFGFGTASNSVIPLGQTSTAPVQVAQNSTTGSFYVGSSGCIPGCNVVTGFNGFLGNYQFNSAAPSQVSLSANASPQGVAIDSNKGKLFIADSANSRYYIVQSQSLGFQPGSSAGFAAPSGTSAGFLAVESAAQIVAVSETTAGSVYFFNEADGSAVPTTPANLSLVGGGCSAGNVSYVAANPANHLVYVACANSITTISTAGTPTFVNGTLANSTVALPGITSVNDLEYVSGSLYAVGGTVLMSLSSTTGAALQTIDFSNTACSVPLVGGVTSDGTNVYVSDTTNSKVYILNASNLSFKSGNCATSVFTTTNLVNPTKLSFF